MASVRAARWVVLWLAPMAAGLPWVLHAQVDPGHLARGEQAFVRVIEMHVRPDAVQEWTRLQGEEVIPAQRKGGLPWVDVWRSGGAGDPYFRSVVVPLRSLAELDDQSVFQRALGTERAEDLLQRHRALIVRMETRIVRPRPDLSFGRRAAMPSVGILSTITVAHGRVEEFEKRLRTSVASELQAANVAHFQVGEIVYGGEGNQYFALLHFDSYGSLARGHPTPLDWALGTVGVQRLAEERDSPVVRIDRTILQYEASLSSGVRE